MGNFWDLSDGDDIANVGTSFETGGGSIEPIPTDTTALAIIDEAKWDADRDGNQFVSLRWSVLTPAEYKNRKVFHKLWVSDLKPNQRDPEKYRDKQKKMLAAIDKNAGGKLFASGKRPTDETLGMALTNKPMQIKIMLWELAKDDGSMGRGNWIAAVAPRAGQTERTAPRIAAHLEDDDAPF